MNIRQLEILEAIEQSGTFTGAAKKLHLTQSAVSHAISELERQAKTELFDRLARGVRLTPCGVALLEEARGILAACRSLEQKLDHLEEQTPIHVASSITIACFLLPPILKQLKNSFPELQINVRVASANQTMELLQRGEADIAFWEGAKPKGPYQTILLGSYRLCAACAPDFPVVEQALSVQQLRRYPLLLREQGSAIRDVLESTRSFVEQRNYPVWESVNSQALIQAAKAGLGITILPEKLLADSLADQTLRTIRLEGIEMENKMFAVLYREKYLTFPMQLMLERITEMIQSQDFDLSCI